MGRRASITTVLLVLCISVLGKAQCNCPPIELEYEIVCTNWADTPYIFYTTLSGGCAEQDSLPYIIQEQYQPEQYANVPFNMYFYGGETPEVTVLDSDGFCQEVFSFPELPIPQFYHHYCPVLYDCVEDIFPDLPSEYEVTFTDTIYITDELSQIRASWVDNIGCERSLDAVYPCDLSCEGGYIYIADNGPRDPINCTQRRQVTITMSPVEWVYSTIADKIFCQFGSSAAYIVVLNEDTIATNWHPHSDYSDFPSSEYMVDFPTGQESSLTFIDKLSGCAYTSSTTSDWDCATDCNCDNLSTMSLQECQPDGSVDGTYVFSNACQEVLWGTDVHVYFDGQRYETDDTLRFTHQEGDHVIFPEVTYLYAGNDTLCTKSFDFGPAICADDPCECPPIEVQYEGEISEDSQYKLDTKLVFSGGCAGQDGGQFKIWSSHYYEDFYQPGDTISIRLNDGERPEFTVIDSSPNCVQDFQLPEVILSRTCPPIAFACPPELEHACGTWELHFEDGFDFQIEDATLHTKYGYSIDLPAYRYCSSACLDLEVSLPWEPGCDFLGNIWFWEYHSELLADEYDFFNCYDNTVEVIVNGSEYWIAPDVPVIQNYHFDRNEGLEITLKDHDFNCYYEYQLPAWNCPDGCSCDFFEPFYMPTCIGNGMAEVTFDFTRNCPGPLLDGSIEVIHNGITYLVTDTLILPFQSGDDISLESVSYYERGNLLCTKSFNFGGLLCVDPEPLSIEQAGINVQHNNHLLSLTGMQDDQRFDLEAFDSMGRCHTRKRDIQRLDTSSWPRGLSIVRISIRQQVFCFSILVD